MFIFNYDTTKTSSANKMDDEKPHRRKHITKEYYTNPNRKSLTGLEQEPETYDYEGIIKWLVDSHWVENYVRLKKGANWKYTDDFIQSVWVEILSANHDKVVEAYNVGKARCIAYFKAIINHNIISSCSKTYNAIQRYDNYHQSLSDTQWDILDTAVFDDYDYLTPIKKNTVRVENPYDDYLYTDDTTEQ